MSKTQISPWDVARERSLVRDGQTLERGVNYFVEKLESLGCKTYWSCEGHPKEFYIVFRAPYKIARRICACGYFKVEIECCGGGGPIGARNEVNLWSIRLPHITYHTCTEDKNQALRWASIAWEKALKKG